MYIIMQTLIEEHHNNFKDLYPDMDITTKLHYLVHMPGIMSK